MADRSGKDSKKKDVQVEKKDGEKKEDGKGVPLTEGDIKLLRKYGKGPYSDLIKKSEDECKEFNQKITVLQGIKESDTGLSLPAQWNLKQDQ